MLPHDLGDPVMSTTTLWWNAHVAPLTTRWWNGPGFFPAAGTLALSDHRLGESLIATPLQWAGASAITAYNLTLLATFPLCALAAWWLAFTLTARHDAAWLCAADYGFDPYRVAHIEHLELLAAFGMPAALAALHRFARTRRPAWLMMFAGSLLVQGLCTTYYTVFFAVLLAMWMVWFLRRDDLHHGGGDSDCRRGRDARADADRDRLLARAQDVRRRAPIFRNSMVQRAT